MEKSSYLSENQAGMGCARLVLHRQQTRGRAARPPGLCVFLLMDEAGALHPPNRQSLSITMEERWLGWHGTARRRARRLLQKGLDLIKVILLVTFGSAR